MTQRHVPTLRKEFLRLLTTDVGKTKRSKGYNRAVFRDTPIDVTPEMILEKFDQAWDNISR